MWFGGAPLVVQQHDARVFPLLPRIQRDVLSTPGNGPFHTAMEPQTPKHMGCHYLIHLLHSQLQSLLAGSLCQFWSWHSNHYKLSFKSLSLKHSSLGSLGLICKTYQDQELDVPNFAIGDLAASWKYCPWKSKDYFLKDCCFSKD